MGDPEYKEGFRGCTLRSETEGSEGSEGRS